MNRGLPAAISVVVVLAIIFGGATRPGYIGDVVVQVAACLLLSLTLWRFLAVSRSCVLGPAALAFWAAVIALCVVQTLPAIPGFGVRELSVPISLEPLILKAAWWSGVSLTPAATWMALVSAIVPLAIFAAMTQCDAAGRILIWRVLLVVNGIALLIGILQTLQGSESALRFFAITNKDNAVGFFANRNHFSAQLYVTLAFVGAWIAVSARQLIRHRSLESSQALAFGGAMAFLILATAGLAMAQSRAGILIAMFIVAGIGVMAILSKSAKGIPPVRFGTRTVILALAFSLLLTVQFGLHQVIGRFQADIVDNLRWPLNWATFQQALAALPFGTGLGSFPRIYAAIEAPVNLQPAYVNRAHDDLAEFLLETGLLGLFIIAVFFVWFIRRAGAIWRPHSPIEGELYLNIQRAASLALIGLLLHSLVDYGLRTTALSALFAFSCGLLTRAPNSPRENHRSTPKPRRDRAAWPSEESPSAASRPTAAPSWGENVEWPDSWRPDDKPVNSTSLHHSDIRKSMRVRYERAPSNAHLSIRNERAASTSRVLTWCICHTCSNVVHNFD